MTKKECCKCSNVLIISLSLGGLIAAILLIPALIMSHGHHIRVPAPPAACEQAAAAIYQQSFDTWYGQYDFFYSNQEPIFNASLDNYITNELFICEQNLLNQSYTVGHNIFSGMNTSQFSRWIGHTTLGAEFNNATNYFSPSNPAPASSSVDWQSYMTPVKNQGDCGSCYANAATELIEFQYALKNGIRVLSTEQIIDCDKNDDGCSGGIISQALEYVASAGGLTTNDLYPSTASAATGNSSACQPFTPLPGTVPMNVSFVTKQSDEAFVSALQTTVSAVGIYGSSQSFQLYKSGIYTGPDCPVGGVDHAVLLIGYAESYYRIKNSWGDGWGENGYIRIARKIDGVGYGVCNVLQESAVLVDGVF